jgi:hypothetical protein
MRSRVFVGRGFSHDIKQQKTQFLLADSSLGFELWGYAGLHAGGACRIRLRFSAKGAGSDVFFDRTFLMRSRI